MCAWGDNDWTPTPNAVAGMWVRACPWTAELTTASHGCRRRRWWTAIGGWAAQASSEPSRRRPHCRRGRAVQCQPYAAAGEAVYNGWEGKKWGGEVTPPTRPPSNGVVRIK
ncbi:hypothetical protein DdX_09357 [Ditylenchus destructor]|uniref:Uncharacterized protein n=1 Tax=Ditylenchus destructor TaxID=166010 RepID=A0AAD4N2P7_9BILA|nr:hypothetical protein DdX_09357 [Ditylenchus destructor]